MARLIADPPTAGYIALPWVISALAVTVFSSVIGWQGAPERWFAGFPLHLVAIGAVVLGIRLGRRGLPPTVARLVLAFGATVFLNDLVLSSNPQLFAVGYCLAYLHAAVFVHLALALPDGRAGSVPARALVVLGYLAAAGSQTVRYVVDRPDPPPGPPNTPEHSWSSLTASLLLVVLGLATVVVLTRRWYAASGPMRRTFGAAWATAIIWILLFVAAAGAHAVRASAATQLWLFVVSFAVWVLTAAGVLLRNIAAVRLCRWRLAAIALELERDADPARRLAELEQNLATALGDPTLRVAYLVEESTVDGLPDGPLGAPGAGLVDIDGRPADPPATGQTTTPVHSQGRVVAVITHDESLRWAPELARMAAATAGVTIEKARLYATVRAQVARVSESRQRLVTAAIDERLRIQRDLHDGAQQQLFATAALLDLARHRAEQTPPDPSASTVVGRAQRHLADAIEELRELIFGIYPQPLVDHGLAAALGTLAGRSPVPVTLSVTAGRWPRPVEFTVYFVAAEALANVYRHADASAVTLDLSTADGRLVLEVGDDGAGGADPPGGSGLRGLRDRVAAIGGTVTIDSLPGAGTRIRADIPSGAAG